MLTTLNLSYKIFEGEILGFEHMVKDEAKIMTAKPFVKTSERLKVVLQIP
jgi:hypothetical protein